MHTTPPLQPSLQQTLNQAQLAAVCAEPHHLLILAGAGSGKTRVLVHRIAWLMQELQVAASQILAVTFTNKAAREMRARIEKIQGVPQFGMWVGTFHGLAHRLLRQHWQQADLPQAFQILDSGDQLRLVKRLLKQRGLDDTSWPPKQIQSFINKNKEQGLRASQVKTEGDSFSETMKSVYADYEKLCQQNGVVDFAELLLRSLELLRNNAELLQHYQNRFRHILVDEFQDTNPLQYKWLQLLAGTEAKLMVVGDDDQSIYSWRGAKVAHIQQFERDYPGAEIIRLEQNYRSTQIILQAANTVIANNQGRLGKELWTEKSDGEKITLYEAFNERDEACYVLSQIQHLQQQGIKYRDMAIVYRANAQSRILEEELVNASLPYRIYGGLRFYERAEIKDALAYLRLLLNPNDDAAFERVVNFPTRGIGQTSLQHLRDYAKDHSVSLHVAAHSLIQQQQLTARSANALQSFLDLILQLTEHAHDNPLDDLTAHVLKKTGLMQHYQKDRTDKGQSKVENLDELLAAITRYLEQQQLSYEKQQQATQPEDIVRTSSSSSAPLKSLTEFLGQVALEAGEQQAPEHDDYISLMTLHAAKGLEFPILFMTGVEEGLFPHRMCIDQPGGLEEERRLCYVGITRAMKKLYISHAQTRNMHGSEHYHRPSRFIDEIPDKYLDAVRTTTKLRTSPYNQDRASTSQGYRPTYQQKYDYKNSKRTAAPLKSVSASIEQSHYKIGQKVRHARFGQGVILNYEGEGEQLRLEVRFRGAGSKWLLARLAKLEVVS